MEHLLPQRIPATTKMNLQPQIQLTAIQSAVILEDLAVMEILQVIYHREEKMLNLKPTSNAL
jgi:hypothetical protein